MKKRFGIVVALLLAAVMSFSLVGCGGGNADGKYSYSDIEISGVGWDAMDEATKAMTKGMMSGVYNTMSIEVAGTEMTMVVAGQRETAQIKFDGNKIVPEGEGADEFSEMGSITYGGGKIEFNMSEPTTKLTIKIVFKK